MTQPGRNPSEWRDEIESRREVLEQVIPRLPPTVVAGTTKIASGADRTHVIWGDRGQHLASFRDRNLAVFTSQAAEHVKALLEYISVLEEENYRLRQTRRQLAVVRDELDGAADAGLHTKQGQARVRRAHTESRRRPREYEPDWDY